MEKSLRFIPIALLALAVVLIAGCSQPPAIGGTNRTAGNLTLAQGEASGLSGFSSAAQLEAFLASSAGSGNGPVYANGGGPLLMRDAVMAPATAGASGTAKETATSSAPDYSQTNDQVTGVDEADSIKTDGTYIYTYTGPTVYIVKAVPGENASVVSRITLPYPAEGLFIANSTLAVYGNDYNLSELHAEGIRVQDGMTYLRLYDVSDHAAPVLTHTYLFEGNAMDARLTGGRIYLVTLTAPQMRPLYPTPLIVADKAVSSVPVADVRYFPIPYANPQFATVNALPIGGGKVDSQSIMVESGTTLYMSPDSIYLASTKYINQWEIQQNLTIGMVTPSLDATDKALIKKIDAVDPQILSKAEKQQKVLSIIQTYLSYLPEKEQQSWQDNITAAVTKELKGYRYGEYTRLVRIGVEGGLSVDATGMIPGHLNNQFAMDEWNGTLRVATTTSARWFPSGEQTNSSSHVFTLGKDLKVEDQLDNLASGEQIYATRFVGPRLYMVTFRQTDPFFVFDLSDPHHIAKLGELRIPGFSRYLQPYDNDTLIGIGHAATDTGSTTGLKIALYDISDVANPKELASYVTDERYAQSTAEWEHKAFLFSREKHLLVIPAFSSGYDRSTGYRVDYNGAMVFAVNRTAITLRGIVDHSQGQQSYGPLVERSLYIGDLLYTKSADLLRINRISDLAGVKNITLAPDVKPKVPIY